MRSLIKGPVLKSRGRTLASRPIRSNAFDAIMTIPAGLPLTSSLGDCAAQTRYMPQEPPGLTCRPRPGAGWVAGGVRVEREAGKGPTPRLHARHGPTLRCPIPELQQLSIC
jgi:hypothetical protein